MNVTINPTCPINWIGIHRHRNPLDSVCLTNCKASSWTNEGIEVIINADALAHKIDRSLIATIEDVLSHETLHSVLDELQYNHGDGWSFEDFQCSLREWLGEMI